MRLTRLLVTCEHGGNRVPAQYRRLFLRHRALLDSHRGYDPGALRLARELAATFDAPLVYSTTSRLLVELNRSPHHRQLFSAVTRALPPEERSRILAHHYFPYRARVADAVRSAVENRGRIVHISCHSFTPRLDGDVRRADVGLLYDPARSAEAGFCSVWQNALRSSGLPLVVRRNYPYRGYADGLTTALRKRYPDPAYAGIEVEVNQKFPLGDARAWRALRSVLVQSLRQALERQTIPRPAAV